MRNWIHIVVGNIGTGKTDWIKRNIVFPSSMRKTLVIDTYDNHAWRTMETHLTKDEQNFAINLIPIDAIEFHNSGLYRTFDSDPAKTQSVITEKCWNSLLIIEDATKMFDIHLTKEQKRFLIDYKNRNLCLVFVFHALADIPRQLFRLTDYMTLFKTGDDTVPNKIEGVKNIYQVFDLINASDNPYIFKTLKTR